MRILHVATLVSPDGAFGGPVRVALNQLQALAALGHDVELVAGYRGYSKPPTQISGVETRLFPVHQLLPRSGFAGLASPRMHAYLKRRLHTADIVHVHLARDLVTLPAARATIYAHVPLILQTHGMVDPSRRILSVPLDYVLTRPILRSANAVLHLSVSEREHLQAVAGSGLTLRLLPNGVPVSPNVHSPERYPGSIDVLFLGRLHHEKRPMLFAEVARSLHSEFPNATFSIVGPDEGEEKALLTFIQTNSLQGILRVEGALDPGCTSLRMAQSAIFVNPRKAEPFAMAVLEAAAAGLPVVVTRSSGIADEISEYEAGMAVGDATEDFVVAVRELLANADERHRRGENSARMVAENFTISQVARRLSTVYQEALGK